MLEAHWRGGRRVERAQLSHYAEHGVRLSSLDEHKGETQLLHLMSVRRS